MTQDDIRSMKDEIAYIKALAEEGRRTPVLGGGILIAAGLIFGLTSIIHWLIAIEAIAVGPVAYAVIWVSAMATFFACLFVLIGRNKGRPGAASLVNQAVGTAWMGVGLLIFVMSISIAVISWRVQSEILTLIFPSMIFAAYGSGWAVSAAMSKSRWQWWLAIAAWAAAPAIAALVGTSWIWLAYAGGLVLLALVPGVVLVRQEPAETV
ncbi:hypothetical protein [Brevundimonas fluminis]|jgi:hypothetical protein|uniref:hypothetical protein n=1 Tax=Brevundimonas fluminis TaxID=2487274 RepID=UPI000F65721E|nr:hypothetical protein [Brevundimonas fluminis]